MEPKTATLIAATASIPLILALASDVDWQPVIVLFTVFIISSLAGLARILGGNHVITGRIVAWACLTRGLISLGVASVAYGVNQWEAKPEWLDMNIWLIVGGSVIIGLSDVTAGDVIRYFRRKTGGDRVA